MFATHSQRLNRRLIQALSLIFWLGTNAHGQVCPPVFQWSPTTQVGVIDWKKFPQFTLPFTVVYGGPRLDDSERLPLLHGFSHLATFAGNDGSALPLSQRAMIWYGLAYSTPQPWSVIESPFNNNLAVFREKWRGELASYANSFDDSRGKAVPAVNLFVADIERDIATDASILRIKTDPLVPASYQSLSDANFLQRYQRDMQKLYAEPLKYLRDNGSTSRLSTYNDPPIRLTTFLNVDGNTWDDWTTNPARLNYLMRDTLTNNTGGPFYQQTDFLMPAAYFCYDYPSSLAGKYLAFLLFQVEANVARTNKDVVVFEWLRYNSECGNGDKFIQPWMAEASAIFPFFSGAKGIWLWENPVFLANKTQNLASYEHYIYGLYRLSQFNDFFTGNYQLYIPKTARDHFAATADPIWRGVVKDNKILVAAHNPFATDGRTTTLPISYGDWKATITLTGTETFLCSFDLPKGNNELSLVPNPSVGNVTVQYGSALPINATLSLFDASGRLLRQESLTTQAADRLNYPLSVQGLPAGLYFVRIEDSGKVFSRKLIVQ